MSCKFLAIIGLAIATCTLAHTQGAPEAQQKVAAQPCSNVSMNTEHIAPPVQLRGVKRIFVDSFGEDPISKEVQSMIVTALVNTKRFTVTEDRRRADATLKGVGLEKTSQEVHAYGEGTAVGSAAGSHQGSVSGGSGGFSGSSSGGFVSRSLGINDSSLNTETINNARIAVRLINSDGDVIWTTTQESKGAKYKSATADVADMCAKQLLRDVAKIDENSSQTTTESTAQAKSDQGTK
jgi:curli biogenesis system outer membrane secretion channel CsgG